MNLKSERLRKLETELEDLEQWLKLGLVPKKDLEKHKEEITLVKAKVQEEKNRLRFMKESGDAEEYVAPKRTPPRQAFSEHHTMPDMDIGSDSSGGFEMESETFESDTTEDAEEGKEETIFEDTFEEDPFSDKNRWKRGVLKDSDEDSW